MLHSKKGDIVRDSSGMGNDGKAEGGPKWVDGKYGGGMEFDGVDDMVVVPDSDVLEFDGDFTLAVWIKTEARPPFYVDDVYLGLTPPPENIVGQLSISSKGKLVTIWGCIKDK